MVSKLTHIDDKGQVKMVDVSDKDVTSRQARATASIKMSSEAFALVQSGEHKKGDVIATAKIAGIMAAKKTADIIPMCHPLNLSSVKIEIKPDEQNSTYIIYATCKLNAQTGVEMEALHAATTAALTIYDMCKAVDKNMLIEDIHLLEKSGGKSGNFVYKKRA